MLSLHSLVGLMLAGQKVRGLVGRSPGLTGRPQSSNPAVLASLHGLTGLLLPGQKVKGMVGRSPGPIGRLLRQACGFSNMRPLFVHSRGFFRVVSGP